MKIRLTTRILPAVIATTILWAPNAERVFAQTTSVPPSATPSGMPSNTPSDKPSNVPSNIPSDIPSENPSQTPSLSMNPSESPSENPSESPSDTPSSTPSEIPSSIPSENPSLSLNPSESPSNTPSQSPSNVPSAIPSNEPSANPSETPSVSSNPSDVPSNVPSDLPSSFPSSIPSFQPSLSSNPSSTPSLLPSLSPSDDPSSQPSFGPSLSQNPSDIPSDLPSFVPSTSPSSPPSIDCTDDPTYRIKGIEKFSCAWVGKFYTNKRCQLGEPNPAYKNCPATCKKETCKVPTTSPTASPSFASDPARCTDDPSFVVKNENKGCSWVAMRRRERCGLRDASDNKIKARDKCKAACDLRCLCKNTRRRFRIGTKMVGCKKINPHQDCLKKAGQGKIVADFCPRKCKNCYP